ncbi:phage terminase large subunit family protein [Pseudomonas gessardii]|uniref:Phage terminase large subunit family protein n=1 Tax=Pseudomonas gessardii TaxID=78544 RepID=A0ABS9FBP4_9PSED|nr:MULTISPECIES: phage terminase large subunit family protein [Pseudomonas]MCF4981346.1 phage terminase large subunit family protein [Pseudomonas gessardii]MCF4992555.1 phage terminase large subunit family protein [Pseudomonas gessardii]MCF5087045.1 phage terminase large subunit family protein [Pseudomonas gessardii]MCF5096438.1 phage terminase large subunit family protein [Pseudomonas gessardii]MCF5108799.1 phage terminase large subunit family protein [Pseudomonas gessardii]
MHTEFPDGAEVYREAYFRGLQPDPDVWIDQWADEYMRIPRDSGAAEPGQYRTSRTPYAREPMRCLSPAHPCKRVITMVASQLMKTQIGLNWIGGLIHMAPSNILALLPSLGLAKRVSSRISKTIKATPVLRERVASSRSRDSRNTMDTKEFEGGSLYVTTAGSAANLSELSARYVYGDEIDRWEVDIGEEGDPIELAETRGSTFGRNAKFYFSSSPTIKDASRIDDLFEGSDQRYYYVPCPTCGHMQTLEWERLHYSQDFSVVHYECAGPDCDVLIEEHHKGDMLARGEWRAHAKGDGETVGFHLNALYSPLGWTGWKSLAKQFEKAKKAQAKGDLEPMQVFYNTRLAKVWDSAQAQTKASVLIERARREGYSLGAMPAAVMMITGAVDVQADRLEFMAMGWGVGMERWVIDHRVIAGDPSDERTWAVLDELLKERYRHPCGVGLGILAVAVDSGGHHTDEVYQFCRVRRWRNIFAIKGASKPGKPVIAQRPSMVDVTWKGQTERGGAELWFVGTDTAKDWIYNRYPFESGPGALHFANDLPDEFFAQCVAERKVAKYVRGHKRIEWIKGKAERNEALDLMVYCLAMAHYLGINRYQEHDWDRVRNSLAQAGLFDEKVVAAERVTVAVQAPATPDSVQQLVAPVSQPRPVAPPQRRSSTSGYLKRR